MHASSCTLLAMLLSGSAVIAPTIAAPLPPREKDLCYREFDLAPASRSCTLRLASLDPTTRQCRLAASCTRDAGGTNTAISRHLLDDVKHLRNVDGVLAP